MPVCPTASQAAQARCLHQKAKDAIPERFELSRGNRTHLAGERLNHSAKVSWVTLAYAGSSGLTWKGLALTCDGQCKGAWPMSEEHPVHQGPVAQWIARLTSNQKVASSSLAGFALLVSNNPSAGGLVGYDVRLTRGRSRVRSSLCVPIFFALVHQGCQYTCLACQPVRQTARVQVSTSYPA